MSSNPPANGPLAVPREFSRTVLIVDAGNSGTLSPRFHNLVVNAYREWHRSSEEVHENIVSPDIAA